MKSRTRLISAFVAAWTLLFHYESLRAKTLNPLLGTELPKTKFLFPPAGWIMFYRVEDYDGHAEVYGRKSKTAEPIDPHRIFATRWVGYDNIRRNVLITALERSYAPSFCRYLKGKFPDYEEFFVLEAGVPSVTQEPGKILYRLAYKC